MGLIRNGIYGYRLVSPVGFLRSLPQAPRNSLQNALTWNTAIREYTSYPSGLYQSAFCMPLKYGGIACRLSGNGSVSSGISATASMSSNLYGSSAVTSSIAGGVNLISNPTGAAQVVASPSAKGWITCKIQIGANPTAFDVAQAVWGAVASMYNITGTMGASVNAAGAGGNPWSAELATNNTPGTFGWFIQKLLSVAKFVGLK